MRLDHIAYRVADRNKTAKFLINAFNYKISDEFEIEFYDGTKAKCYALEPPERFMTINAFVAYGMFGTEEYHSPPEIFVSEGSEGSIVKKWVDNRGGVGGVHHMAYQVDNVEEVMSKWIKNNWAEFTTDEPIKADGLVQCFTRPHKLTGIIYEFIYRTGKGFSADNVKELMKSTSNE